jgi:hypothetical protein
VVADAARCALGVGGTRWGRAVVVSDVGGASPRCRLLLPDVCGAPPWGGLLVLQLLADVARWYGGGEVGYALVVFEHAGCPGFEVDWCALCGLEEGVVVLDKD